ncbi:ABC transporter permease [Actinoplanes sp. G11-F43]|uniref:ABC transporter permease n=1 Tax=Actinoplanes sp. G11-F43 TaxID=3424130 RepID=UPI003D352BE6
MRLPLVSSWRTALRVARREMARAKGRSALVVAMIAVPVSGLGYAAASYDMFTLTPAEQASRMFGAADAIVTPVTGEPIVQDVTGTGWRLARDGNSAEFNGLTERQVLAELPDGSRLVPVHRKGLPLLTTTGGLVDADVLEMDLTDPIHRGDIELPAGRAPAAPGEVAMSEAARERFGDTIRTPDGSRTWTAVGTVEDPADLGEVLVFAPGGLPAVEGYQAGEWLVDSPDPILWDDVRHLNRSGIRVQSRAVILDPPEAAEVWITDEGTTVLSLVPVIVGLAVLEIILLAGPAFAVGARRRQRSLALVAANGGTRAHLRRIVLADGVLLGLAGAAIGLVLALLLAVVGRPLAEELIVGARAGGIRFSPTMLTGIVVLAMITGLLAAAVPAFTAARADVVTALTGRRGVVRSKRRWVIAGLVLAAAGAGISVLGVRMIDVPVIAGGLAIVQIGLVLCTPALVGLVARLGGKLPPAPRIALRDTARNRASAAPAVAAVMAAVAGTVTVGVYLTSTYDRSVESYRPALPLGYVGANYGIGSDTYTPDTPEKARAAVAGALPGATLTDISETVCRYDRTSTGCMLVPVRTPAQTCPGDNAEPDGPAEVAALREDPRCAGSHMSEQAYPIFHSVVGGRDTVAAFSGATGDSLTAAAAVLDRGGVLVDDPFLIEGGQVTVVISDPETTSERTLTVPGGLMPGGHATTVLSPELATAAGFDVAVTGVVAATTEAPPVQSVDRLNAALAAAGGRIAYVEAGAAVEEGPMLYVLAAASALITLGAAAVATGLAAADGRADLSTLAAIGASPGIRRLLSISQSGVIAGLGSILGIAAGLGSGLAVLAATNLSRATVWPAPVPYPLSVPWLNLLLILVVPLVAMLGAGLLTRARLPSERRRPT